MKHTVNIFQDFFHGFMVSDVYFLKFNFIYFLFFSDDECHSIPLTEGKGKVLKIKGFSPNQRAAFLKLIMAHGLQNNFWKLLNEKNN